MPPPLTGHLDADAFYVSAERVRSRFLCAKPVGVLGNQGACVIAKSYEMRAAVVRRQLTRAGEALWYELNGDPLVPILTERPPHKTLSRGGSLGGPTDDPDRLHAWLARNLERLVEELEHHAVCAGRLVVYLMHKDASEGCVRAPLMSATDRFDVLLEAAAPALRAAWRRPEPVTRMHLIASQLQRPGFVQRGLFDPPDGNGPAVATVKREVNAAAGRFALRGGATLGLSDVYRDAAQSYDICDVRGKICF